MVSEILISVKNLPTNKQSITESFLYLIESGKWKKVNNNIEIRFDNRSVNQGGPQLHLKDRRGIEWAYRNNGNRSERNKYTSPSTTEIKDIVRNYFKLDQNTVIESIFLGFSDDGKQLLMEIMFD